MRVASAHPACAHRCHQARRGAADAPLHRAGAERLNRMRFHNIKWGALPETHGPAPRRRVLCAADVREIPGDCCRLEHHREQFHSAAASGTGENVVTERAPHQRSPLPSLVARDHPCGDRSTRRRGSIRQRQDTPSQSSGLKLVVHTSDDTSIRAVMPSDGSARERASRRSVTYVLNAVNGRYELALRATSRFFFGHTHRMGLTRCQALRGMR